MYRAMFAIIIQFLHVVCLHACFCDQYVIYKGDVMCERFPLNSNLHGKSNQQPAGRNKHYQ